MQTMQETHYGYRRIEIPAYRAVVRWWMAARFEYFDEHFGEAAFGSTSLKREVAGPGKTPGLKNPLDLWRNLWYTIISEPEGRKEYPPCFAAAAACGGEQNGLRKRRLNSSGPASRRRPLSASVFC